MKSMKKMLCLLLVAMLLVAAIPVAASADVVPGSTEVEYSVVFAAEKPSAGTWTIGGSVAHFKISSNSSNEDIRLAAESALANAGISAVTPDLIAANVDPNFVHNVTYGNIRADVDTTNHVYRYILAVNDRASVTTVDENKRADIWLDSEGTGNFVKTGFYVMVTVVKTQVGNDATNTTYSLKSNGGASVAQIRSALGADFNNKNLSVTMQGPDGDGLVRYNVTVTGTNGSTGTNVPSYDGTTNNNNGIPIGGSSNNNNNTNNGGSSSNNGGSSNTNNGTSQNLGNGGTGVVNGSNTDRNRFPYDVVLHIYQNNKVDAPVKNIVINDSLAADGTVSLSEVKTEVMNHFSAKTSAGIGYAGLYYARGNWVKDYATYNGEYDAITGIDSMRQVSQVDINVMITNANAKTTAKADSSNPKTGDTIFVPFMVMGLTATALAAAYVFGKKRIAR